LSTTGDGRPEDLLRDADTAMYRAKAGGKARHEVFDTAMHTRALKRLRVETELRRAIEREQLRIHYQPIVSLATGRLMGFEALLRWYHPERGLIPPAEFIPVAEETRLIIPIGQWVLGEACRQMRAWQTQFPTKPPLSINVNLSGKQFAQPDLVKQIAQTLQETGLDARSLNVSLNGLLIESFIPLTPGERVILTHTHPDEEASSNVCAEVTRVSTEARQPGAGCFGLRILTDDLLPWQHLLRRLALQ